MSFRYRCKINGIELGFFVDGTDFSPGIVVPLSTDINATDFNETMRIARFLYSDFMDYFNAVTWHYPYTPKEKDVPDIYIKVRNDFLQDLMESNQNIQEYRSRTSHKATAAVEKKKKTEGYVYLLKSISETPVFKIGRTKKLTERIGNLGTKLPFEIVLLHTIKTSDSIRAEQQLHAQYADKRMNGEWFNLTEEDVTAICAISELIFEVES